MIRLSVLQSQWLMLGLGGGLVTVAVIVLGYLMIWRPRLQDAEGNIIVARGWRQAWRFTPWVLVLLYVGTIVYMAIYAAAKIENPPSTW